jgi:hypothetical protein
MDIDPVRGLADTYLRFSEQEARGRSVLYEDLGRRIAQDLTVLGLIAALPLSKQQPNLILAAVRQVCGTPDGWGQFREWLVDRWPEIAEVVLTRRTQTNEPARCATLLPLLARLPQPLALLEVGASAGLCLLPDRYAYDYGGYRVEPVQRVGAPVPSFSCRAGAATPLPERGVQVVWRAGLDLAPVDVRDPEQVTWLEHLVWPGQGNRLELLRAAIEVARADPPRLVQGDLRHDLPDLAAQAPKDATLVVFHTAVLAYVADPADRLAFAETVAGLDAVWIANEDPGLFAPRSVSREPWPMGRLLLTRDAQPVAWNDGHGTSTDWIPVAS